MIDSILIGMSGLDTFSEGLRVISNNSANLNTPGFKGSSLQFGNLVYADSGVAGGRPRETGFGVSTMGTSINFKQGQLQSDGKPLDLGINGEGLFTLRDEQGDLHYTRAGQFHFDADGTLVDATGRMQVVAVDPHGVVGKVSLDGHRDNPAKATTNVVFQGVINNTPQGTPPTVAPVTVSVNVLDSTGLSHTLSMVLTIDPIVPGEWGVVISDGQKEVGRGSLQFNGQQIDPSTAKVAVTYKPAGSQTMQFTLDFGNDVVVAASGSSSTIKEASNDGLAPGSLTGTAFDETGTLVFSYSNGQTVKGSSLQLARFDSTDAVKSVGNNLFDATDPALLQTGMAGKDGFGAIQSSVVELSNVDLSQEFSDLVIMQRGYQASSQVVSTANDMLQELFSMSGRK